MNESFRKKVALAAAALAAAAGAPAFAQNADIAGVWQIETPVTAVRTADGAAPPLTPAGSKLYQEHLGKKKRGDTSYDSATWCSSVGMPRAMLINYPFEIVLRPRHAAFFHEWNFWARIAYFDGALGAEPKPGQGFSLKDQGSAVQASDPEGPMGLSKAKWEGDTLVIETTQLRPSTLIDNSGLPHSDQLKLIEHISLRGPDLLEDRIRFEDPETFTQTWETVVTYRRAKEKHIEEDVCLDRLKRGEPAVRD